MIPTGNRSGAKILEPVERMILFNDGTNQLLLSAFFNEEIKVIVLRQEENDESIARTSTLIKPDGTVVCYADTKIMKKVCSSSVLAKVKNRCIPLGGIIKSEHKGVEKKLISFGKGSDRFFRKYEIAGDGLYFIINEEFPISAFKVGTVET
ncbi:MAG: hypothetical protein JRN32_01480 [Nitrososphaerota archaeon]|jgi:chorismate-pyruvate lyase|nr:hypothetical protein [Nitrososphaerota archaeon]MDG7036145.1 hypothetical protein [Nitrososphaerota archaeon]MDG7037789.1 hypothetical protein [Nitrososphaerota archaeon]MDG7045471.1 hypothetical protein [Nitrososphaerota archaeon]